MWKHTAASVLALIASGCASMQMAQHTPIAAAFQMAPVGQAAPPAGLAEFCAREGDFCQAAGAPNQTEQASTGAAFQPAVSGEGGAALFRALLAAQIRERPDAQAAAIVRRVLTDADWRALESINRSVNWRITPATDMEIWHVEDRWSLPLTQAQEGARGRGDCEDFALEKRQALIRAGFAPETLSLASVYSSATGLHAVLVVHADRGDFVLDNLTEEVRLAEAAPYLWLSMQTGPNLLAWTGVRLARAPAREAVPAPFQTSAPQPAPGEHEFAPTPLLTATALSAPEGAGAAAYAEIAPLAGGPAPDAARQLKSMKPAPLDKAVTLADAVRLRAMLGKAHAAT